ncbi:MAG: LVIVD repeat-containing protein [Actinomycetota bacterium]
MRRSHIAFAAVFVLAAVGTSLPVSAGHKKDPRSENLIPVADSPRPASLGDGTANSDLAFWKNLAFQGSYEGFRIIDIKNPRKPKELADITCPGSQGDMSVWGTLLFRSVDSARMTADCVGEPSQIPFPVGYEGVQIFDVSDPKNTGPDDLITAIATCGGSHTHTLVPDVENDRVFIYVATSGCPGLMSIIEVPLDDPASATVSLRPLLPDEIATCHDINVHLGAGLAAGACNPNVIVWDISDPAAPQALFSFTQVGVTSWHSAAFTWDGEVIVTGWEPGGGTQPACQEQNTPTEKSVFFWSATDGSFLGSFEFPQDQSATENCTVHNYNVVPLRNRYLLVSSYYQGGTNVVDFTDPADAFQVAWSDPQPIEPEADGGAWSSYWYNGFIYESDITEGLNVFYLKDPSTKKALKLDHLNPQTQETLIPSR